MCARSIVGLLPRMAELLCMRNRSWLLCRGWPSCFVFAIDRVFVATDGRAALRVCVIDRGFVAADSGVLVARSR